MLIMNCSLVHAISQDSSILIKLITLSNIGYRFVNPSRASPGIVQLGGQHVVMVGPATANPLVVFLSTMVVTQSNLITPKEVTPGRFTHSIQGFLATIEWERLVGFFCQVFDTDRLKLNMKKEDGLSFSTYPSKTGANASEFTYL